MKAASRAAMKNILTDTLRPCQGGNIATELGQESVPSQWLGNSENLEIISKMGWGGARPNSGGVREGAGRPKKITLPTPVLGSDPRWFVADTEFKRLHSANRELLDRGFETYIDQTLVRIRDTTNGKRASAFAWVPRPSFFQFVFVRLDLATDGWQRAGTAAGVRRILGTAYERPTPVERGFVEHMIKTAPERLKLPERRMTRCKPGDMVLIKQEGPMDGFIGEVEICDGFKTVVWVNFLGRAKYTLNRADVVNE